MIDASRHEALRRWDAERPLPLSVDLSAAATRGARRRRRWLALRILVAALLTTALLVVAHDLHRPDHRTAVPATSSAVTPTGASAPPPTTGPATRPTKVSATPRTKTSAPLVVTAPTTGRPTAGRAPVADLTVAPRTGPAPLDVAMDASGSRPGPAAHVTAYRFDFGDGTVAGPQHDPVTKHEYATAGTYQVTLTITDSADASATMTRVVMVTGTAEDGSTGTPTGTVAPTS